MLTEDGREVSQVGEAYGVGHLGDVDLLLLQQAALAVVLRRAFLLLLLLNLQARA